MPKEKATEKFSIRLTPQLRARIEARADEESRTPSNLLINVVTQYLDEIDNAKKLLDKRTG